MRAKAAILLLISTFLAFSVCLAADEPAGEPASVEDAQLNEQLRINKNALLNGPSDQIRLSAAIVMLESPDPAARQILLAALQQSDNVAARLAVVRALSQSKDKQIADKERFIEPLLAFLVEQESEPQARLAAEALLIYDYSAIEGRLLALIKDPQLDAKAKTNAILALRLQPDRMVIVRLIELLDEPDQAVFKAASDVLDSLGIRAAEADPARRKEMIREIQRIGPEQFVYVSRIRESLEKQINELREQRDWWMQQYLAALDELYVAKGADEAQKAQFLAKSLDAAKPQIRLWGLAKAYQWWVGTEPKTKLLEELTPARMKTLISDADKGVRLQSAKLAAEMHRPESARALMDQMKTEQDQAVRSQQFVAVGQVCRYGFSPTSPVKPDPNIRTETLTYALEYLFSAEVDLAEKGAEVIRNLLENDGLSDADVDKYLGALSQRYAFSDNGETLRAELLNSMATLCGHSVYKAKAAAVYQELFVQALADEAEAVQEAAVSGLINIDKAAALRQLRDKFVNSQNENIRKMLIALAEQVGTQRDLPWLAEKLPIDSEGPLAWKAMLRIFREAKADVLNEWLGRLEPRNIADSQIVTFLQICEGKAAAENNLEMLENVRLRLAALYNKMGEYNQAAKCFGDLLQQETDPDQKEFLKAELLTAYLNGGNLEMAVSLIANRLQEADIKPQTPLAAALETFFTNPAQSVKPDALLAEMVKLNRKQTGGPRPNWQSLLKKWNTLLKPPAEPNQPKAPAAAT